MNAFFIVKYSAKRVVILGLGCPTKYLIMLKRVIINLLLAFTILPLFTTVRDYLKLNVLNDHSSFSGTFSESLVLEPVLVFIIGPVIFAIFILLPYNMFLVRKNQFKGMTLLQKVGIFELLMLGMLCIMGRFLTCGFPHLGLI